MKQACHIYLTRHGQTDWNVQKIIQGQQDIGLNELGVRQAEELRERLKGVKFAAFYASDLERARRTAEIIAGPHGLKVKTQAQLRERYFAHHEGKSYPGEQGHWKMGPEVEALEAVHDRFRAQLLKIARDHPGENVLVATHAGTIRILLAAEGFIDQETAGHTHPALQNGAYTVLASDGRGFEVERIGAASNATSTQSE